MARIHNRFKSQSLSADFMILWLTAVHDNGARGAGARSDLADGL
jgi:hypothetical protein